MTVVNIGSCEKSISDQDGHFGAGLVLIAATY